MRPAEAEPATDLLAESAAERERRIRRILGETPLAQCNGVDERGQGMGQGFRRGAFAALDQRQPLPDCERELFFVLRRELLMIRRARVRRLAPRARLRECLGDRLRGAEARVWVVGAHWIAQYSGRISGKPILVRRGLGPERMRLHEVPRALVELHGRPAMTQSVIAVHTERTGRQKKTVELLAHLSEIDDHGVSSASVHRHHRGNALRILQFDREHRPARVRRRRRDVARARARHQSRHQSARAAARHVDAPRVDVVVLDRARDDEIGVRRVGDVVPDLEPKRHVRPLADQAVLEGATTTPPCATMSFCTDCGSWRSAPSPLPPVP